MGKNTKNALAASAACAIRMGIMFFGMCNTHSGICAGFWPVDGQFGRQCGGPAPIGGQLTVGNAPVDHADVGIIDPVGHGSVLDRVGTASVGDAVEGIVVESVGHGLAVVVEV
jgi:hypothetical protein